jgi:hypothetical protein
MFKLEERHRFFKRLQGEEKFAKTVEEWTPLFLEHSERIGKTKILEVAISMGQLLADGGHDPNEMFAVAVELLERNFSLNTD